MTKSLAYKGQTEHMALAQLRPRLKDPPAGTAPRGSSRFAGEHVITARTAFETTDWTSNPRQ